MQRLQPGLAKLVAQAAQELYARSALRPEWVHQDEIPEAICFKMILVHQMLKDLCDFTPFLLFLCVALQKRFYRVSIESPRTLR